MNLFRYLKKGLLFYWYTGERKIVIIGFSIALLINLILLFFTLGYQGMIIFILFLIMDHLMILFFIFYLIIRNYIPFDFLKDNIDENLFKYLLVLLICWIINRIIINITAERSGYQLK